MSQLQAFRECLGRTLKGCRRLDHDLQRLLVHQIGQARKGLAELGICEHRGEPGGNVRQVLDFPEMQVLGEVAHQRLQAVEQLPAMIGEERYQLHQHFVEAGVLTELQLHLRLDVVAHSMLQKGSCEGIAACASSLLGDPLHDLAEIRPAGTESVGGVLTIGIAEGNTGPR
jgi:hypothetical protein